MRVTVSRAASFGLPCGRTDEDVKGFVQRRTQYILKHKTIQAADSTKRACTVNDGYAKKGQEEGRSDIDQSSASGTKRTTATKGEVPHHAPRATSVRRRIRRIRTTGSLCTEIRIYRRTARGRYVNSHVPVARSIVFRMSVSLPARARVMHCNSHVCGKGARPHALFFACLERRA